MKPILLVTALLAASTINTSAMAASAQVDTSGKLLGITEVDLGSRGKFDVSFDKVSYDFTSYDTSFATNATTALYNLFTVGDLSGSPVDIYSDGYGSIESNLYFTFEPPSGGSSPIHTAQFFANDLSNSDTDSMEKWEDSPSIVELGKMPYAYAATWTPSSVSAVPVPAAAFMFAPALLGFMGLRRKARKQA